jgi:phytase-like protein
VVLAGSLWFLAGCAAADPSPKSKGGSSHSGGDPLVADSLRAVPVGRFDFDSSTPDDPTLAAEELSGLASLGRDDYLAVSDAHAVVHRLTIRIDPATGAVRSATVGSPIPLKDENGARLPEPANAKDREAIACDPDSGEFWIADERTGADPKAPSISRHRLSDGGRTARLTCDSDSMLTVFRRIRSNKGFESLALAPDRSTLWTANEDALTIDGAAAGKSEPGIVRLQQLDRALRPLAQFAYTIDPWRYPIRSPILLGGQEVSGLSEILVLPRGRLLALERSFGGNARGMPTLENRLYLVDPTGATDLASLRSGLSGRSYVAAKKVLLWRKDWGLTNSNFEGMTLGPTLADGSRSLILIADNDGGTSQALFTLRLVAP